MCGLLQCSLYSTRDAARTRSNFKLTKGSACPCVCKGHIEGEDFVATVHGDDITIGGERSAVKFLIKLRSKKVRDQEASDRRRRRP